MRVSATKRAWALSLVFVVSLYALPGIAAHASAPLFADGFETGNFSVWTKSVGAGMVVQQQEVFSGQWAARATSTGLRASTYKVLSAIQSEMYCRARFKIVSHSTGFALLGFRTSAGTSLVSVGVNTADKLYAFNRFTTKTTTSRAVVGSGSWHVVELHALVNDTASRVDVWLDGTLVPKISRNDSLGTSPIGRLDLGDSTLNRIFDVAFDDVVADASPVDMLAPSTPTGLVATSAAFDRVDLAWNASTDGVGVAGYTVYRDGTSIGTVDGMTTAYSDTTVSSSAAYTYTVDAFDDAGNRSSQSDPLAVSTPAKPDTTPPTSPEELATTSIGPHHVALTWDASTDEVGVTGYTVYRDGTPIGTVDGATTAYDDTTVSPSATYSYTVDAFDAASNRSPQSGPLAVSTPAVTDTTPPASPTGLATTSVAWNQVGLTWDASADEVRVTGYTVYRDGTRIGKVGGATTSYDDSTVSPSTAYTYTVDAFDAAGNHSIPSDPPLSVATSGPVVMAAGDIACDPNDAAYNGGLGTAVRCRQLYTSNLLTDPNLSAVLALGDTQNDCGGYQAFMQAYDPTWGRAKAITHPVPGNHEYLDAATSTGTDCSTNRDAAGYFRYFGPTAGDPSKGYYSFDIGTWHIVALNAECNRIGGCVAGSPQEQWLHADLVDHPSACTLVYWHQPRFSSSRKGNDPTYDAFWQDLYAAGAEIVLNGHVQAYERFAPQTPAGVADPNGIREFIVGTGGASHAILGATQPTSEVRDSTTFGVLRLTLLPTGYEWTFIPEAGSRFTDSGTGTCH